MNIIFRKADINDCELLFQWVNDEAVRLNAFNTNQITYEEHVNWFCNRLKSEKCIIYICCIGGKPVGQVRIDFEADIGIISYSIAKEYRSMGYGTKVLEELTEITKNMDIKKLIGKVKLDNIASQKAFRNAGYTCLEKPDYIEFYKHLTGVL